MLGNTIARVLNAGIGLLFTVVMVNVVGKLYTTKLSADTLIVVICLDVRFAVKEFVISSTID